MDLLKINSEFFILLQKINILFLFILFNSRTHSPDRFVLAIESNADSRHHDKEKTEDSDQHISY